MDNSAVALSVATVGLVGYVLYERAMSSDPGLESSSSVAPAPVGMSRRSRRSQKPPRGIDCKNVSIGSPDFARCSTELGAGRTVLAGDPVHVAHNINTGFVNDEYTPQGAQAFPFSASSISEGTREGGRVNPKMFDEYGKRFGNKDKKSNPLAFKGKSGPELGVALGAAVSPSAMGASREEMLQSTKVVVPLTVDSNTGGNLNLLHPLE